MNASVAGSRRLLVGNWKMNTLHDEAQGLANELLTLYESGYEQSSIDVIICPPHVHLTTVAVAIKDAQRQPNLPLLASTTSFMLGAQDCSHRAHQASTGDVSAKMLRDIGAEWVIIGHSERRQYHGEDDTRVYEKFIQAKRFGCNPIVCVGEDEACHQLGMDAVTAHLSQQLSQFTSQQLSLFTTHDDFFPSSAPLVIAYEPIWAIGTGKVPAPESIAAVMQHIHQLLPSALILYGGSVNPGNTGMLATIPFLSGFLVGGASLSSASFLKIHALFASAISADN